MTLHEQGHGAKRIGRVLNIDRTVIREWLKRYRQFGEQALQPHWRSKGRIKKEEPLEPKGPLHLYEKYREALDLYVRSEHSRAEVCRRCGVDYASFSHYVRRYYPQHVRTDRRGASAYQKAQKREAKKRYRKSVKLYSSTEMTAKEICERTGVSVDGFRNHVRIHHRELLLRRKDLEVSRKEAGKIRLRQKGRGQTLLGHRKYKEAIAACGEERYIEYNVSQIARMYGLDGTSLGHQLRVHHPEILSWRERERMLRGVGDNLHRGARAWCIRQYAEAVEVLRTSDKTIREAADACGVSFTGLRSHLLQYHKDIVEQRAAKREKACKSKREGAYNGHGVTNRPSSAKVEHYREAVDLYRTTLLPLTSIAGRTGVSLSGLTHHIYRWHRDLVLDRKGIKTVDEYMDLSRTKHYRKSVEVKYAEAVCRLKGGAESVAGVASEFGFNAETFREYVSKHEPGLARQFGQTKLKNGKTVLSRSEKKYAEAVRLYRTTAEPLKSIAGRLGLVYGSVGGFIRRNMPEVIAEHEALVGKS